jgi:hypothetical protein
MSTEQPPDDRHVLEAAKKLRERVQSDRPLPLDPDLKSRLKRHDNLPGGPAVRDQSSFDGGSTGATGIQRL